jgi:glycosyltransferase involved in cell wall biosynthesis
MSVISIIIPTYNRSGLVETALDSVAAQDYRPVEVLVVDDGSTDDTETVVRRWKDRCDQDQRLSTRYLYQSNQGAPAARNRGLEAATGEYVLFLDSDDRLAEDALTGLVRAQKERNADVVYGDFVWIYENGRPPSLQRQTSPSDHSVVSVLQNCPRTSTALIDRELIGDTRWRENLPCAQEVGFYLDLAIAGATFEHIEEVVLRGLHHSDEVRIKNNHVDGVTMGRTLGSYLLDVEPDLRSCGKEASIACDKALLHFSGLMAAKGERDLAAKLLERANQAKFMGHVCTGRLSPSRFSWIAALFGVRGTDGLFKINRSVKDFLSALVG